MPEIVELGPLVLRWNLLTWLIAIALGWTVIEWRLRTVSKRYRIVSDLLFNALLIVLLYWKFGIIFDEPEMIWERPIQLLLVTGTGTEVFIGSILGGIYLLYGMLRRQIPFMILFDTLPFGVLVAIAVRSLLLWDGVATIYTVAAAVALLVWLTIRPEEHGAVFRDSLKYGGTVGLAVTLLLTLHEAPEVVWLYLTPVQWIFLLASLSGLLWRAAPSDEAVVLQNTAHTKEDFGGKEWDDMERKASQDSREQRVQEQQNREETRNNESNDRIVDKKLDGPNRPST